MSATVTMQRRVDDVIARADDVLRRRLERERDQLVREDAERMMADAAQARADAERRRECQARFDPAFAAFGMQTPQAVADESPGQYRRRLFEHLRRKLPDGHEWASVRADDIPVSARATIEALVIDAAKAEGERPSTENLPDTGMIMRTRTDADTGTKYNEFYGRESFIAQMGRSGRRVAKIVDPRSQAVIWGRNFDQAR
jgi:hypothetical protein